MDIKITHCPTAWVAPSHHGHEVSQSDIEALRQHALKRDAKSLAAAVRASERGRHMAQYSPRSRPR